MAQGKMTKSVRYFKRSEEVLVGGVNSPVRAFKSVGGNALIMDHGKGANLFDVDGRRYTDYCLSWGALILGHAHKDVIRAIKTGIKRGVSFGVTTKPEIEIARFIVKHVPSIEQVRFVNSGTEATMSAIRLARGFTGREKIVKFDGCYHGHCDDLLTTAGSGVANLPASSSQGIPLGHIQNTVSLPFNNIQAIEKYLDQHGKSVACVILEPVAGNMGVVVPEISFLKKLRELTSRHGIVLIFDEVMSGFRTSLGCVQSDFNVTPDLTCLGKIIGGGFPVGAYGGRRDIMQHLAPVGGVYQAGTFSGNPVVMRAGLATLNNLSKSFYRDLNESSNGFSRAMNQYFDKHKIQARLSSYKSMISVRFRRDNVGDYAGARASSSDQKYARLFSHLLSKGVYFPPADLEAFFISSAHSHKQLSDLQNALKSFFMK